MNMLKLFNLTFLAIVIIGLAVQFDSVWCYPSGLSIFRFSRDISKPLTASSDGHKNHAPDGTITEKPYPVSHWNIVYIVMKLDPEMRLKKVENGSQDDNVKRKEEQIDFDKIEQRLNSNGYDERKLRGSGYLFRKDIRVDDNGYAHIHYYFRRKNGKDDDDDNFYLETAPGLREGIDVYQEEELKKVNTEDNIGESESGKVEQEDDEKSLGEETGEMGNKNEVAEHGFEQTTTDEEWEDENGDEEAAHVDGDEENGENLVESEEEGSVSMEEKEEENDDGNDDDDGGDGGDYGRGDQEEEAQEVYMDENENIQVIDEFGRDQSRLNKKVEAAKAEENTNMKEVIKSDDQSEIGDKVVKYSGDLNTELKPKTNTESVQLENYIEEIIKNDDNYRIIILNDDKSKKEKLGDDYINIDGSESLSTSIIEEQEQGKSISPEEFYDDKESDDVMEIREDDEDFLDNKETEIGIPDDFQDGSG
ncbi:hypothetical protein LSTR_LSTR000086 [Laodelphax striatellus]|uniref:Uncharacterized protein n=1 Tax=Laodelphax striatellus TaxID=195883 RepID=A0A482X6R6_LAOST|nr:hypothetical protein LSTR_LSTR000086 [Laodelphax striatellus]